MTDQFALDFLSIILEMEREGLVTRTFRRLDPERQQAVINAILDEAARNGPSEINIKNVAARAEVSVGSLYQYFQNREGLLRFAIALVTRCTVESFKSYQDALCSLPLREGIQAYLMGGFEWTREQVGFTRFFAAAAYRGDEAVAQEVVIPIGLTLREMMTAMLQAAQQRGELRPDIDLEAASRVVNILTIAAGDAILVPYLNNYYQMTDADVPFERILPALIDMMIRGIGAAESA